MAISSRRKGVASVVGTVIFVLVFMVALGSLAYAWGLQQQAAAAQESALQLVSQRGEESLAFAETGAGLLAANEGPAAVSINHLVLRYPNGTVYPLAARTVIAPGGATLVESLIPDGLCSPGTATCGSRYSQIVAGNPAGSSVGLVTGFGNTFWYTHRSGQVDWGAIVGFPPQCPAGEAVSKLNTTITCTAEGSLSSWDRVAVPTTGSGEYATTGLAVVLPANGTYAFYVFTAIEPQIGIEKYNFEVHTLAAGASLLIACSPMSDPEGGGNLPTGCVSATGTPIATGSGPAFGVSPPVYATPGIFGVVYSGPEGSTLEIDFACTFGCGGVMMKAGSFMVAQALG
jgi:O-acetyl-ADP-ribose deacetylase (regulator of RNase III)